MIDSNDWFNDNDGQLSQLEDDYDFAEGRLDKMVNYTASVD